MKTGLFVLCFLCATTALAQSMSAGALSNEVQPFQMPSHTAHASQQSMALEQNLLENASYSYAQGERPLWEVQPLAHQVPLGDIARALKKEHETAKKADFIRND